MLYIYQSLWSNVEHHSSHALRIDLDLIPRTYESTDVYGPHVHNRTCKCIIGTCSRTTPFQDMQNKPRRKDPDFAEEPLQIHQSWSKETLVQTSRSTAYPNIHRDHTNGNMFNMQEECISRW